MVRPVSLEDIVLGWSEAELQRQVVQLAEVLGWSWYHTHDSRRSPAGYPDLHFWHTRKKASVFVELKTEKGKLRPAQVDTIATMGAAGLQVQVLRPSHWIDGTVRKLLSEKWAGGGSV